MISSNDWLRYITRLKAISDKAASEMQAYVDRFGFDNTTAVVMQAYSIATRYGEAAGAAACDMYDAVAAASKVSVPAAEPATTATYGEMAKAVKGALNDHAEGQVPQIVGRKVKQAGADTTLKNAIRDGAQFAWVPHGDTCAFCMTLASRGWQYASKAALKGGHAEHIHSNCDCEYAIRFSDKDGVRGYDPDRYLRIYRDHNGDINSIRRELYQENKEKIKTQKREAYADRKEYAILQSKKAIEDAFKDKNSSESIYDIIVDNHDAFMNISPEGMKGFLESAGYEVLPLGGKSKHFRGVPFEKGGGYRVSFGGDGYFQYHPAGGYHKLEYWKISHGGKKGGVRRYDRNGKEIIFHEK